MKENLTLALILGLTLCACNNDGNNKPAPGGMNNEEKSGDCLPDSISALAKGKKR